MSEKKNSQIQPEKAELIIERTIDAPRQLVWDAFTKPEHLKHWWGPVGFEIVVSEFELKPGGKFHYQMKGNDGHSMWGLFNYREIQAPERIVFTNSFSDETGAIARAPFFDGGWPLEVLNTWVFEEIDGKTILTLHGTPLNASEEELQIFTGNKDSMNKGFGGTFDALDNYLVRIQDGD